MGGCEAMRIMKTTLFGIAALSVLAWSAPARAQVDIYPPLPNVLLLIDSSGSMEYSLNAATGSLPATCDPMNALSDKTRWIGLVEVLTGAVSQYGCYRIDRDDPDFNTEYTISAIVPYDKGYFLPHHRPVSNGCVKTPGIWNPLLPYDWDVNAINTRPYNSLIGPPCTFNQASDGLLDVYRDRLRFGLFTFDSEPDAGI